MTAWIGMDILFEATIIPLMVNSQGWTSNNFCWKCWSVAHFTQTEHLAIRQNRVALIWTIPSQLEMWVKTQKMKPMAQDLYSYHVCEYSWSEYEYKYWAVEYKYIASEYKYLEFVLKYNSSVSTSTDYYNSASGRTAQIDLSCVDVLWIANQSINPHDHLNTVFDILIWDKLFQNNFLSHSYHFTSPFSQSHE